MTAPDEVPAGPTFTVTILHAPGKRLTKLFTGGGLKLGAPDVASYRVERHEVDGFRGFASLITQRSRPAQIAA